MSRYGDAPPGNSADFMPLDTTLNKDVHEAVNCHVNCTNDLPKEDPRKFGMSTPKECAASYKRIIDPENGVAPTPARILHDIEQVFEAIENCIAAEGRVLQDHNGHRKVKKCDGTDKRGGSNPRKRGMYEYGDAPLHRDAIEACDIKIENAKKVYAGIKSELMVKDEIKEKIKERLRHLHLERKEKKEQQEIEIMS